MKKILVIEDNLEVRENLVEILELSNYEVFDAENGLEGVKKAKECLPDLILCDVMMPKLDGFGVLNILNKSAETISIPFIFLTAKAEKTDFRKGMNLGADDYITKPFDDTELLDSIERRLKKAEKLKTIFDGSEQSVHSFINEAKGQKELASLSDNRSTKNYRKKEYVFEEGETARQLFFVKEGKIKTVKRNEEGKEYITQIYKEGEFLGHWALIQASSYTESALALEDSILSLIPQEDFNKLLYTNRDFTAQFVKMLANNKEEKENQLLSLAYNSIRKRVAEALVVLSEKYDKEQPLKIMRDDLAGMVGTAKESVIRVLTDFKKEKIITIEGGAIQIIEIERLKKMPN